jgi:hypothetical protein
VFESYDALVEWLQSGERGLIGEEERNVPEAYAESEDARSSDDDGNTPSSQPRNCNAGNGNGNDKNGGKKDDPPKPPSSSSSSSSSSEDDRPKSLILPWYQVPPRMSHKERKRLYGDLSKIKAYRERFNHPPVVGRGVEEDDARRREELRVMQEEEKRQQEEQRRQTQLGNRPRNGYTFRRDTAPSPERSTPPSPPGRGQQMRSALQTQPTSGRGQQSRSTLQSQLENSLENNWGFRQSPSPSPPGSRQGSPPLSPPPPGFIRCPDCTVNNRDITTSCGTCGMPWPAAPAPGSQARGIVPYDRQPDALFGDEVFTYSDDEDDDDMYVMTGGAGPAGTVDAGGDPDPIPATERTRLQNAREAALYDAALREGRDKDRQQTALLNGQDVPESQPYFYDPELDAEHITVAQEAERRETIHREGILDARRAKVVRGLLARHSDPERQQWTVTFDRALAQRFEDPSEATMLRRIEETRYNTRYNGLRWPEDGMTGWPDAFDAEFRQYILDATRYLEQRDVFGNLAEQSDAEDPGDETETETATQPSTPRTQTPNWVADGNEGRLDRLQWLRAQCEQAEDEGRTFPESLPGWNNMTRNRRRHIRGDLGFLKDQRRIAKGKNKAI